MLLKSGACSMPRRVAEQNSNGTGSCSMSFQCTVVLSGVSAQFLIVHPLMPFPCSSLCSFVSHASHRLTPNDRCSFSIFAWGCVLSLSACDALCTAHRCCVCSAAAAVCAGCSRSLCAALSLVLQPPRLPLLLATIRFPDERTRRSEQQQQHQQQSTTNAARGRVERHRSSEPDRVEQQQQRQQQRR